MYYGTQQQKQGNRNTLILDIPGLGPGIKFRFPDCRLPVCGRCKKNYKTRDMCRNQGEHTDVPWSPVFICVTLDHSCTDSNNNLKSGPFVSKNIDWMPYCYKTEVSADTLICAACKTKNYTRKQCRIKSRHRHLPWSTLYTVLSLDSSAEESSTRFTGSPVKMRSKGKEAITAGKRSLSDEPFGNNPHKRKKPNTDSFDGSDDNSEETSGKKEGGAKANVTNDDVTRVDVSRTFLLEVSATTFSIKWLDFDRTKANPIPSPSPYVSSFSAEQSSQFYMPHQSSSQSGHHFMSPPNHSRYYQNMIDSGQHYQMDNNARQPSYVFYPASVAPYAQSSGPQFAPTNSNNHDSTDYHKPWSNDNYDSHAQSGLPGQSYHQRSWSGRPSTSSHGGPSYETERPQQQGHVHGHMRAPPSYHSSIPYADNSQGNSQGEPIPSQQQNQFQR